MKLSPAWLACLLLLGCDADPPSRANDGGDGDGDGDHEVDENPITEPDDDDDSALDETVDDSEADDDGDDGEDPNTPDVPMSAEACNGTGRATRTTLTGIQIGDILELNTVWLHPYEGVANQHMLRGYSKQRVENAWLIPNGLPGEYRVDLHITTEIGQPLSYATTSGLLDLYFWNNCEWVQDIHGGIYADVQFSGIELDPGAAADLAWCAGRIAGTARGDAGGWSNDHLELTFSAPVATGLFTNDDPLEEACPCIPSCDGRVCGGDGCGGSCGECGDDQLCTGAGECICRPQCDGRSCGDDGCGGACGTCDSTHDCTDSGQCVCEPSCDGRSCGGDGCGGVCGTCDSDERCTGGSCVFDPNLCNPVTNTGCAAPNGCFVVAGEDTRCVPPGTGGQGSSCSASDDCRGGFGCFGDTCRKICSAGSDSACPASAPQCVGVTGWFEYGACQ